MEVTVREATGVPEGTILSIRAGNVRRQGNLSTNRSVKFSTSRLDANPFTVDLYAPIGSKRLTLTPSGESYYVQFGGDQMSMILDVADIGKEAASTSPKKEHAPADKRQKHSANCQEYIDKHKLVTFVQNLMQSVLVEQPEDPFKYMEAQLKAVQGQQQEKEAKAATVKKVAEPVASILKAAPRNFSGAAFTIQSPEGVVTDTRPLQVGDMMGSAAQLRRFKVENLAQSFRTSPIQTPLTEITSNFTDENSLVTQSLFNSGQHAKLRYQLLRAGPRRFLHFEPKGVIATIVTCGGLCPGLNAVVRELVEVLSMYGVRKIYGIRGGYKGVTDFDKWMELTHEDVRDIHELGGTMLTSDRGNPPIEEQAAALAKMGVSQHFVIGGDGTHRGAYDTYLALKQMGHQCAVVGVPKTIDNDVPMLDRTFGFDTACTEAAKAIHAAYVEATCNANCIGLVKLMGRHCGYIAMNACLASRLADICLLPEMNIDAEKVLQHCLHLMQTKGHAVVVVAEGCGNTMIKSSGEKDAGGNVKLADVGPWLRDTILARFKKVGLPLTIKYIDPTYMIRAVPPNANDGVYCAVLAGNAVHAAMAGYTGITIGKICERYVIMPMQAITQQPGKKVELHGEAYLSLLKTTLQPDFSPDGAEPAAAPSEAPIIEALMECSEEVKLETCMGPVKEVRRLDLEHLRDSFGAKQLPTTLTEKVQGVGYSFLGEDACITQTLGHTDQVKLQMSLAAPRQSLYFQPSEVAAAIVTCGGLCPGLNTVIREIVNMLFAYGVMKVYGIVGGFKGAVQPRTWLTLTPDSVKDIHMQGGTILVADRGNPPPMEIAKMLRDKGVRQFFVLGGDGTHRGAYATYSCMKELNWECAVVGVPKTIDNDISLLDRTFGFETACTEAQRAIDTAYVEATCNANAVGLVKLMGRHCGYLAMMSTLAARVVDICLLPEMDIDLQKVLDHTVHLLSTQGYAVIVVAEGCGDTLISGSGEVDAGGNKKLADAGLYLKDAIGAHFKTVKLPVTVKYVDPTYMVRAIPANASDSIYCATLAQGAVHAAMAGYTGVTCAKVDESFVWLPIGVLTGSPNRKVDVTGRWFERLMTSTQQPNLGLSGRSSVKPVNPLLSPAAQLRMQPRGSLLMSRQISASTDIGDELRLPDVKLTIKDGYGETIQSRTLERTDILKPGSQVRRLNCFHLSDRFGSYKLPSPLKGKLATGFQDEMAFTTQSMTTANRLDSGSDDPYYHMVAAGPRENLHFDPHDPAACAAIVSCGGICPGLNSVIREVVLTLWAYGVRKIYGIKGGFKGVVETENWIKLTPDMVQEIHKQGGTILVSDRGNPPPPDMAKALKQMNVRQYFVLGGDGTHKGAMQTFDACLEIDYECAVIGVPKTIDNDVPLLDQTFGFDTACTEAVKAVESAYTEATCNANCIGLVKLMGRHCGFIALHAALAARHADIVLLPEMSIDVDKVLEHTVHLMKTQRHAVIVVAEGCGDTIIKGDGAVDAGGNKIMADVGPYLKDEITARFKKEGMPLTIKYIDPTYMIRATPANAYDSSYCSVLAQNAAHAALAGYSGVTVGKVYHNYVYLPIYAITQQKGRRVNPNGRWFMRLLETTRQPDFRPADYKPPVPDKEGLQILQRLSKPGSINQVLQPGDEIIRFECVNLGSKFSPAGIKNPAHGITSNQYLDAQSWTTKTFQVYHQMLRGGPRQVLHFDPAQSAACIVTCGGLCPGLNSVIREIVMNLSSYGVKRIYGCRGGFKGMVEPETWMQLTPEVVKNIHTQGGTILVSDRGNPPHLEIAKSLQKMGITQYFVIGGDGTHKGAMESFMATQEIGHGCAVVGVPKTIDNDIKILDRSFGFKTACTEAVKAIDSAYVEATSNKDCIAVVRLMGRHCGWIALEATLAARNVDICLLPEMAVSLPKVLTHATHLMKTRGYAVIVVAEGCGDTLIKSAGSADAGGNKVLADVGPWFNKQLVEHFKKMQLPLSVKYIDPTYTIRAVPANANDSVYCSLLASQAVHASMAGYSGITVGKVDERFVMLPIHAIVGGQRKVDLKGKDVERLMSTTGQPDLSPSGGDDWALMPPYPEPTAAGDLPQEKPAEVHIMDFRGNAANATSGSPDLDASCKLKIVDGFGKDVEEKQLTSSDLVPSGTAVRKLEVMHLSDRFTSKAVASPIAASLRSDFVHADSWLSEPMTMTERVDSVSQACHQLLQAGPYKTLHFDPKDSSSSAAILTAGGLCPGENAAIREIVNVLTVTYGVQNVYGIQGGFSGIVESESWLQLTPEVVEDIHQKGGTFLKAARGNPHVSEMAQTLKAKNVRQFFVIGGEGAHKGALQIFTALLNLNHECACLALPTTINNDVHFVERTLGFDTACTVARDNIDAGYVEATCNANCIGLVKIPGEKNGFLTLEAVLASRHVDVCLLPEMEIDFAKVQAHCLHLLRTKGYAVVVVADGCKEQLLKKAGENVEEGDVGLYCKDKLTSYFKENKQTLTVKYIDPTYMLRSVRANSFDMVYANALAQNLVHGAMAGITGACCAKVYNRYCFLPLEPISRLAQKDVSPSGRWFARMLFTTKQPAFEPDGFKYSSKADGVDLSTMTTASAMSLAVPAGAEVRRLTCANLSDTFASRKVPTPLKEDSALKLPKMFVADGAWTTQCCVTTGENKYLQLLRGGPREVLHFDPSEPGASAAIVTCGGLCPGLNSVIRELANMLRTYGVKTVYGIKGGYGGCVKDNEWVTLGADVVQDIHMLGGSILVSDRGNPPHSEIAATMKKRNVRQFFVLGGDGTHRGAMQCFLEMTKIGHECAVVGVPKTIDNDIPVMDRSFGFETACTEAERAISSAYVESTTNANCIGLVKLMGRHCGWIAATASLANSNVDVCLIPEMEVSLPKVLDHVANLMRRKKHAVIVVAEGCGDTIISSSGETDAGGNKKLADVGPFLKDSITAHLKKNSIPVSIKYIDPTYMIRSVAANSFDSKYCAELAQEAVHGAMAGYTGITVGKVDNRLCMLPIFAISEPGPRKVDVRGRMFEQLMRVTQQPSFAP
eukprot:TRINITY_DN860_c0_g3_i2.p1 TRINITY_DN860_c0_g3~~TRINITY_DN860_c0_g3_i2.p1  ORF type:complete len:3027 (-),score=901.93 TRINITY_DN860_c0_g3_i2:117-9197(-)